MGLDPPRILAIARRRSVISNPSDSQAACLSSSGLIAHSTHGTLPSRLTEVEPPPELPSIKSVTPSALDRPVIISKDSRRRYAEEFSDEAVQMLPDGHAELSVTNRPDEPTLKNCGENEFAWRVSAAVVAANGYSPGIRNSLTADSGLDLIRHSNYTC